MNKVAIVYWSGTGNTEEMARAIAEGAREGGADVDLLTPEKFLAEHLMAYSVLAFGCPAMGDEELEESEVEPMFSGLEGQLKGKRVALFGSYGWGDGEWMRNWCKRCSDAGAELQNEKGLIANEAPGKDDLNACKALGAALANW